MNSQPTHSLTLRLARPRDAGELLAMMELSIRELLGPLLTPTQLEASRELMGLDTQLIADGTYYVVEAVGKAGEKELAACGGWSMRKTLYGSDHGPYRDNATLDPARDAAKIRAFFVHPEWTRRGIASLILKTCEDAAYARGFRRFEMGATLTGVPMYAARGYAKGEQIEVPLPNGMSLTVVRMAKKVE